MAEVEPRVGRRRAFFGFSPVVLEIFGADNHIHLARPHLFPDPSYFVQNYHRRSVGVRWGNERPLQYRRRCCRIGGIAEEFE